MTNEHIYAWQIQPALKCLMETTNFGCMLTYFNIDIMNWVLSSKDACKNIMLRLQILNQFYSEQIVHSEMR